MDIRSAIRAYFQLLDERFRRQRGLPAPSRQPLLEPSMLIAGSLGLVGAQRDDDAERLLLVLALDAATDRDVLLVVQDRRWVTIQMVAIASGIAPNDVARPSNLTADELARLEEARREIASMPIEVSDSIVHNGNTDDVAAWLRDHENGLAVLPAAWPASLGGDEDRAADFVRNMKAIARETAGTVLLPWKLNANRRNDPRPMLRDLAVSGAAEDDSDLVILFYESEYGVEIKLAKNRHGETGYLFDSRELGGTY